MLWVVFATIQSSPAQTPTPQPTEVPTGRAAVVVAGRTLFQLAGETQADAIRRAETVNRRLQLLIEREEAVEKFEPTDVITQGGEPLVMVGSEPIVTVTSADVADNLVPAKQLAVMWGGQLSLAVRAERFARTSALSNAFLVLIRSAHDLLTSLVAWLPRLIGVGALILLFWPLAHFARWLATKATQSTHVDANITQLIIALAFYGVWAIGFLAMLSALGFSGAGLAAAVGASGLIIGFAFQDVLSHFFAGLLILVSRQFYIGGQIRVGEHEGIVERIDLRALYLRTADNRQITIPNGQVFNSAVVVNTSNPYRRREFTIGIDYQADTRHALNVAVEAIRSVEGVLAEPAPQALVSQLNSSSVDLRIFFYTHTTNGNWLESLSECILRVKEAFKHENIDIPFSTHTIDVRHVGDLAEMLQPAGLKLTEQNGHAQS